MRMTSNAGRVCAATDATARPTTSVHRQHGITTLTEAGSSRRDDVICQPIHQSHKTRGDARLLELRHPARREPPAGERPFDAFGYRGNVIGIKVVWIIRGDL